MYTMPVATESKSGWIIKQPLLLRLIGCVEYSDCYLPKVKQ